MQRIGNQEVKRVCQLEVGDIFKVHYCDPWVTVIRVDNEYVYFKNECSSVYKQFGVKSMQWVSMFMPKVNNPYIAAGFVRPGSVYTNGTPYNIAKELGDLNKFYEN